MRIVIDTQLLLRASIKVNTLSYKLVYTITDKVRFVNSNETLAEAQDVLSRSELRQKFSSLTDEVRDSLIAHLQLKGDIVELTHPVPKIVRDPKDDIFLATALAGQADYLVTQDKDLLVLETYGDTKIVELSTFWMILNLNENP